MEERAWAEDHYGRLKGGAILDVWFVEQDGLLWPVVQIQTSHHGVVLVTVQRDAEGNGPGFLHIATDDEPA